jgi:hypothetical protein
MMWRKSGAARIMRKNSILNPFLFLHLFALLILPSSVFSIGVLDSTFGGGGMVMPDFGSEASLSSLRVQTDGKIVVLAKHGGFYILLRFNADGSFDTTFGTNGRVNTPYSDTDNKVKFTIQSNGLIAVGDSSSVTRYTSAGTLSQTVSFPGGDFAAFGLDGKIATATLLPAEGACAGQVDKIIYVLFNPDGTSPVTTLICSAVPGGTGIRGLWGIAPSSTNTFYIGYMHIALNSSHGRVREFSNNTALQDINIDISTIGSQVIDLVPLPVMGFSTIGYSQIRRVQENQQIYNLPFNHGYKRVHSFEKTAALKGTASMLVLNKDFSVSGFENIERYFPGAFEQHSVFV